MNNKQEVIIPSKVVKISLFEFIPIILIEKNRAIANPVII